MTIENFRRKKANIEKTHPAPDGLSVAQKVRFWRKITSHWVEQLNNVHDAKIILKEERAWTDEMLAN